MANEVVVTIRGKDETGGAFDSVTKRASGLKSALGSVATTAAGFLGAQVISKGFTAFTGGIGSAISGASDLNESLSKVRVVFGENAGAIESWASKASTSMGQSRQQALEAAGTFGNLFDALGLGSKDAANMSQSVVGLATDLSSFNNIGTDVALEKLRAGLVGEVEPLRTLGVNLNAAMVEAKAMEMGLADANGEISESAKVQARYALILEQTKNAQGDFARTSGGLANQQRILKASWTDLKAGIGQALLPVITSLVKVLAGEVVPAMNAAIEHTKTFAGVIKAALTGDVGKAAELFNRLPGPLQAVAMWLGQNEDAIRGVVSGAKDLVVGIAQTIKDFAVWTKEGGLLSTMLEGVRGVLAGVKLTAELLAPVVKDIVKFFQEHKTAAIALGVALGVVLAVLFPLPAAILAIVFAVGVLRKNWDEIRDKTIEVWNAINDAVGGTLNDLVEVFRAAFEVIRTDIETAFTLIRDVVKIVMAVVRGDWGAAWEGIKTLFVDIWNGIITAFAVRMDLLKAVAALAWDAIKLAARAAWDGLSAVVTTALGGVMNVVVYIGAAIVNWFKDLPTKIMDALGDLSDLLADVGIAIIQGLWDGMKEKWEEVKGWVSGLGGWIKDNKGPINVDLLLLYDNGRAVMQGFQDGMASKWGEIQNWISGMVSQMRAQVAEAQSAAWVGSGSMEAARDTGGGEGWVSGGSMERARDTARVGGRTRAEWKYIFGASGIPASEYNLKLREMFGYQQGALETAGGPAWLHPKEAVMPADMADMLRELLTLFRGQGQQAVGGTTVYADRVELHGSMDASAAAWGLT